MSKENIQHTPGPWGYDLNHTIAVAPPDDEEWGVTICQIPGDKGIGRGHVSSEDKANARLIASAPSLLAALEAAYHALDAICMAGNMHLVSAALPDGHGMDTFREAIFKAQGMEKCFGCSRFKAYSGEFCDDCLEAWKEEGPEVVY